VTKKSYGTPDINTRESLRATRITVRAAFPVVFTGISATREEAEVFGLTDIRPPVKRGDLDQLEHGRVVAIVDGELDPATMLLEAEVTRAMRRGVELRGAASVGALIAFDFRDYGMTGIGWVYKAYCAGRIAGADEIAVVYDPLSHRPLTVPLVNIRVYLDALVDNGLIKRTEADAAMVILKSLNPEDRTSEGVASGLRKVFDDQRIEGLGLAGGRGFDIKKHDAFQLFAKLTGSARYSG
jgi:hypothetical protein